MVFPDRSFCAVDGEESFAHPTTFAATGNENFADTTIFKLKGEDVTVIERKILGSVAIGIGVDFCNVGTDRPPEQIEGVAAASD